MSTFPSRYKEKSRSWISVHPRLRSYTCVPRWFELQYQATRNRPIPPRPATFLWRQGQQRCPGIYRRPVQLRMRCFPRFTELLQLRIGPSWKDELPYS
jgi:hypothetical protein